jgi:hypothetical protein
MTRPSPSEVQRHLVEGGSLRASPGADERHPEEDPHRCGHDQQDARQAEGAEHDPDEVDGRLLDLDPGDRRTECQHVLSVLRSLW